MLRYIPNSPNTFKVSSILQNLSNLPGLVTNNLGSLSSSITSHVFFPMNSNPTPPLLPLYDSDEDEPPLLRLKKDYPSRSYFDVAGKIFGKVKNWKKSVYDEIVDLKPIMHDWSKKLSSPKCEALALKLNTWIIDYLSQPTPLITHTHISSSNNIDIEGDDTQILLEESKKKKTEEEEEILRQYQKEQGKKVQEFISLMTEEFLNHEYWSNSKEQDIINLEECIERYVIVKIFRKVFIANKIADFHFWQLLQTYQFIVPKHLDIKVPIEQSLLEECHQALDLMNFFKTPRNKLICFSNCCIIIFNYLEDINHQAASVDEFLPILTYIIIKTAPSSLVSNLRFIEDFRRDDQLLSSWGYFLTNFGIAIHFVYNLNPKQLSTGHEISPSIVLDWTLLLPTSPQNNSEEPTPGSGSPPPTHQSEPPRPEPRSPERIPNSPERIPNSPERIPNSPERIPNSQERIPNSPERIPNSPERIPNSPERIPKLVGEKLGSGTMGSRTRSVCVDESNFEERYKFWNYSAEDVKKEDITDLLNEYKRLALVEYNFFLTKTAKNH